MSAQNEQALNMMTSRSPFQFQLFCNSVILQQNNELFCVRLEM